MRHGLPGVLVIGATLGLLSCASVEKCEPETFGYNDAQRVTFRALPAPDAQSKPCARTRLDVLATQAELEGVYTDLALLPAPAVDFARERVIVREGAPGGTTWAVASGEVAVLGLRACTVAAAQGGCVVEIVAVASAIQRAETRTCEPVGCGVQPEATAIPKH
jgi:hypothetical protein